MKKTSGSVGWLLGCGLIGASVLGASAAVAHEEIRVIASAPGPIELGDSPVRVVLTPAAPPGTPPSSLATLAPDRHAYLILRAFRASAPVGVLYHLYLDLPPGVQPAADDPRHVGTLSFYDAVLPGGGTGVPASLEERFNSYDVSQAVRTLHRRGVLSSETSVTLLPAGRPAAGSRPLVGRIDLVIE